MAKRIQPKAIDLHIADRLRKLLPPLTPEERKQLKANIESDGRVTEPIRYWNDGKRNVVVDGMHRWEIVRGGDIPYRAESMEFASYEEAELWILNHQLGRRNLLKPSEIRAIRGELYNREKQARGGDRKSQESKCQIDTLISDAAEKIGEKAGVSAATVKRDGARVEALAGLTKPAQKAAEKASDKDIKALSRMSGADQNSVARAVRVGQAPNITAAIKATGAKPDKAATPKRKSKGKPPKQYERSSLYKSWTAAMGPLVRLAGKIADGVDEKGCESYKLVQDHLNDATEEMMKWMRIRS